MKILSSVIFILVLISGCSFETPPNDWQYKSVNAFDTYTKDFLRSNDIAAKNDIKRAISHAKKSADLTSLARIYLGVCALNISVGIDDRCQAYLDIRDVVAQDELDAYYAFLTSSLKKEDVKKLPKRYHDFAYSLLKEEYKDANEDVKDMQKVTSKLLTSALLKEKISKENILNVIESASFRGYKKAVLYWLKRLRDITSDKDEISKIDKKILILTH